MLQIVALPISGAFILGVVDDVVGAKGTGEARKPLAISHTPMNTSHRSPRMDGDQANIESEDAQQHPAENNRVANESSDSQDSWD
jgi:hypothetical protein